MRALSCALEAPLPRQPVHPFSCRQMLDARMVSVDAVDEYGNTVLIVAAQNNNKKIVKVRAHSHKPAVRAADVLRRLFCGAGRMHSPSTAFNILRPLQSAPLCVCLIAHPSLCL